jgi:hypothetical protein
MAGGITDALTYRSTIPLADLKSLGRLFEQVKMWEEKSKAA